MMTKDRQALRESVAIVSAPWRSSPYYERAEKTVHRFWDPKTVFRRLFEQLDLSHTVELAVGHGRHTQFVIERATELVALDVFEENLAVCRARFRDHPQLRCSKCDGAAFDGVPDAWASAIYCYDAMVHFSPDVVDAYLQDTARILSEGGRALYHHSNYSAPTPQHYGRNPHARNDMTQARFLSMCAEYDLRVIESQIIDWGRVEDLDCVTLIERPRYHERLGGDR